MRSKFCLILATLILTLAGCGQDQMVPNENFTYARSVSAEEQTIRDAFVAAAVAKAGVNEVDGSHKTIIDAYNAHEPLAQGYPVKYDDEWCATFVSAIAIEQGLTDIIPTECSCERQINLFKELGRWEEDDAYVPLPGDIIYYRLGDIGIGDCTKWSNHVGIVIGTCDGKIRVIEGNNGDQVAYRTLPVDDPAIRGFAIPDFDPDIEA